MVVVLRVTSGPNVGRERVFPGRGAFCVGRSAGASFSLPDDRVLSREHFQIEVNPPLCDLRDRESTNGTWINGRRVDRARLRDGDVISAGNSGIAVGITEMVQRGGDSPSLRCPGCGAAAPAETSPQRPCPACLRRQSAARAESLLRRSLNLAQRVRYLCTGEFTVVAPSGRRYLITRGTTGNVYELDRAGRRLRRYCISPAGVPPGDVMMAQLLMLLTDEDSFRRIAVATDLPTGRRSYRETEPNRVLTIGPGLGYPVRGHGRSD
jgi:hypothetical protein